MSLHEDFIPADGEHVVHVRIAVSSHWKHQDGQLHGVASEPSEIILQDFPAGNRMLSKQKMRDVIEKLRGLLREELP